MQIKCMKAGNLSYSQNHEKKETERMISLRVPHFTVLHQPQQIKCTQSLVKKEVKDNAPRQVI